MVDPAGAGARRAGGERPATQAVAGLPVGAGPRSAGARRRTSRGRRSPAPGTGPSSSPGRRVASASGSTMPATRSRTVGGSSPASSRRARRAADLVDRAHAGGGDRLDQPGAGAEVVLRGRLVALAGRRLHLAQRHGGQPLLGGEPLGGVDHLLARPHAGNVRQVPQSVKARASTGAGQPAEGDAGVGGDAGGHGGLVEDHAVRVVGGDVGGATPGGRVPRKAMAPLTCSRT